MAAKDFVAGMTDRYAVNLYEQLFIPKPWVSVNSEPPRTSRSRTSTRARASRLQVKLPRPVRV